MRLTTVIERIRSQNRSILLRGWMSSTLNTLWQKRSRQRPLLNRLLLSV
jgi:hypothetical protein